MLDIKEIYSDFQKFNKTENCDQGSVPRFTTLEASMYTITPPMWFKNHMHLI
jgi:hypothetical protein